MTPSCPWYNNFPYEPTIRQLLGSTHTAEIPFIFGEVDNLPLPAGNCSFTSSEKAISMFMKGAWTSFSATGNPATSWPRWNGSAGINIGQTIQAGTVDYSSCQLWDEVDAAILQAASTNASMSGVANPEPTTYTGLGTDVSVKLRWMLLSSLCSAVLVGM